MTYLPFDLETALAHPERVVTRDGRKVSQIIHLKLNNSYQPVLCVIDGNLFHYWTDGRYGVCTVVLSPNDLFLLPEVKECWVNVYDDSMGFRIGLNSFTTKKGGVSAGEGLPGYIKTIRITNEPE